MTAKHVKISLFLSLPLFPSLSLPLSLYFSLSLSITPECLGSQTLNCSFHFYFHLDLCSERGQRPEHPPSLSLSVSLSLSLSLILMHHTHTPCISRSLSLVVFLYVSITTA